MRKTFGVVLIAGLLWAAPLPYRVVSLVEPPAIVLIVTDRELRNRIHRRSRHRNHYRESYLRVT